MARADRRKEVLDICLKTFIEEGPSETTVRDLSKAMGLQPAGVLYWYPTKDDLIVACAEEAAKRLEAEVFMPAYIEFMTGDVETAMHNLHKKADEMTPYARFFTGVCNKKRFDENTNTLLKKLSDRYSECIKKLAASIGCPYEEIAPSFYQLISTTTIYMLFNGQEYIDIQMEKVKKDITLIKKKYTFLKNNKNLLI